MGCTPVKLDSGATAIVCSRGRQRKPKCTVCGKPADKLCDHPDGKKTCDKPLCGRCAVPGSVPDTDYCPSHTMLIA